ncbi:MAG: hypothetical protein WAQ53_15555 [Thiofilum sp.]|uniref:hypothetical protein n=1 Tax=Thiofilum sp. TaxID=2212733 RepID=UPI0025E4AFDD|nr:hypothetical protein [Thiofilum sp.]
MSNQSIQSSHLQKQEHFDDQAAYIETMGDTSLNRPYYKSMLTHLARQNWQSARSLLKLKAQIDELYPSRQRNSDGIIGDSAHCPGSSDHCPNNAGVVTALDITHDPINGCDLNTITEHIINSRDLRIKYIIWNGRICSSTIDPWQWRNYNGQNPHNAHAHFSVMGSRALYDDDSDWVISEPEIILSPNSVLLSPVYNRGSAPIDFINILVSWARNADNEIFNWNANYDIYSHVRQDLGPWQGIMHRKAVMLEVMRVLAGYESSWNWQAEHDITNPTSTSDCTKEAGIFQCSANSMVFDASLKELLRSVAGKTDCQSFRNLTKSNKYFAIEYCARLLRFTINHHGPIKRYEIHPWLSKEAVQEFTNLLSSTT